MAPERDRSQVEGQVRPGGTEGVLRIMRENHLLSPYRDRRSNPALHQGEIVTQAPHLMWGTDGARVLTVEEGWGWIFVAIEHWNAECVGWLSVNRGPAMPPRSPSPRA